MVLFLFKQKNLLKQFQNCCVAYSDRYGTAQTDFNVKFFIKGTKRC